MAAVGRVVHFGAAVGADEAVGWQVNVGLIGCCAVEDGKRCGAFGFAGCGSEWAGGGQGRCFAQQRMAENFKLRRCAFGMDLHRAVDVAHPARDAMLMRQTVDEGPEAHTLHPAADGDELRDAFRHRR